MIRVKIAELEKHRNETTFRPYLQCHDYFRDIGINLNYPGDSYDYTWIGQASYSNKSIPFVESIEKGLEYLDKITGDYWLFDGQDSASLIGSYDVFLQSKANLLLKNTLYSNLNDYTIPYINGRSYWRIDEDTGYKIFDFSRFQDIKLSGCNWLSTVPCNFFNYKGVEKPIDVCALFSYPGRKNYEFGILTSDEYDRHRINCIAELKKLPKHINVAMLQDGQHLPREEYYKTMSKSKIIVAPFGYGEIAPRDIEAAMLGCILIKPDMSHINTFPNPYKPGITYKNVAWDFHDLHECVSDILNTWPQSQELMVENMRHEFVTEYTPKRLVEYMYNIFKQEPNISEE